jgi:alkyl hydroperoxide reductase subunit AhpC
MNGAALRGLFIIDKTGKVRSMQINDDSVGRSVDEAIRLIEAFQFADKNGQVCPANWHPGDKTIIPDQQKKLEYFSDAYKKVDPNAFNVEFTKKGDGVNPPVGS